MNNILLLILSTLLSGGYDTASYTYIEQVTLLIISITEKFSSN